MPSPSLPIAKLGREQVLILRQETVNQLAVIQARHESIVGSLQLKLNEIKTNLDLDRAELELKLRAFDIELGKFDSLINSLSDNDDGT